jgi:23S rRNA pseudouridine1911/1915/1917 synthase
MWYIKFLDTKGVEITFHKDGCNFRAEKYKKKLKEPDDIRPDLEEADEFYEEFEIRVDPGQGLLRIDKFLTDRLERATRNKIQNAIKSGAVLVNDIKIKANYRIKPRDAIKVVLPRTLEGLGKVIAQDLPLDILYEDDTLLIVNKKAGMVVHPGISNFDGTLVNALAYHFQHHELPVMPGAIVDRPGLVHRIDKDTSGLLVIAKTEYAMSHLARQFFDHSISRKYLALVWGEPDPHSGTVNVPVGKHTKIKQKQDVFPDGDGGKHAITHYRLLKSFYYVSLLECQLETGRTHQIRVHMKYLGHPLFNDAKYGGDKIIKGTVYSKYKHFVQKAFEVLPRQALHASTLGFIHPSTEQFVHFESPLPADFKNVLELWNGFIEEKNTNS